MANWRKRRPKRRGYVRPSRAKPKQGWSISGLAALTGMTVRTIRSYVQRELIPRPPFQGSATRYDRRQLASLLALRHLRNNERLSLTQARARLEALTIVEVEALATTGVTEGPLADALGIRVPATPPSLPVAPPGDTEQSRLPRWTRMELALGLELHVRDDASPQTIALARRVRELCG